MAILVAKAAGGSEVSIGTVDTEATILASSPTSSPQVAITNDLTATLGWEKLYAWDGTSWFEVGKMKINTSSPDIGYEKHSDRFGYGEYYTSDKRLSWCIVGSGIKQEKGGFGITLDSLDRETFTIYLNDAETTFLPFDYETNDELRHTPLVDEDFRVHSGASVRVGLNGQPIYNQGSHSMGAFPPRKIIGGVVY